MAYILKTNGSTETIELGRAIDENLAILQKAVGGDIEMVRCHDGRLIVLNEEGKLLGLKANRYATALAKGGIADDDVIVGDCVVATPQELGEEEGEGDEHGEE